MPEPKKQDAIAEFYRQLALLLQTRLPLPESVAGIAAAGGNRGVRKALEDIAARLAEGRSLTDALAAHGDLFPPVHLDLIRAAEEADVLPEVLHDIAELARRHQALDGRLKEISLYPFITILFAVTFILLLARFYLPDFGLELRAVLEGPLPPLSTAIFGLANAVVRWWPYIAVFYALFVILWLGLVFGGPGFRGRLPRLADIAPGVRHTARFLDLARFCGMAALMLRRGASLERVLAAGAGMVLDPGLRREIGELRQRCAAGAPLARAAEEMEELPAGLRLALAYGGEADLAEEIEALRDYYIDQAETAARRVTFLWQGITFATMVVIAGAAVFAMFMPMIQLYRQMTGIFH